MDTLLAQPGKPDHYLFVIDTDQYAGGFEREMCAYVTGQIGECEVGEENAQLAKQEDPELVRSLEDIVKSVPDEHNCRRPVSIFPNPRYGNNHGNYALLNDENRANFPSHAYFSVAIYLNEVPDTNVLDAMKNRAKNIAQKGVDGYNPKIEGFRLFEQRTTFQELPI